MSREDWLSLEDLEVDVSDDGDEVVCDWVFVCAADCDEVTESGLCVVGIWVEPDWTLGAVEAVVEAAVALVEAALLLPAGELDVG